MAGGKAKASKAATVQEPSGWLTVNQAVSWIAFRSLAPNWDTAFYFGASNWFTHSPDDMLAHLREMISEPPDSLVRRMRYREDFEHRVRITVAAFTQSDSDSSDRSATIDDDARRLIDHLSAQLPAAREQRARLQQAAEELRLSIAAGALPAYGWNGDGADPDERAHITEARERIPADALAGPVTVTDLGIVPVIVSDDAFFAYTLVWSSLRIPSDGLLRLWPSSRARMQAEHLPSSEQARPGRTAEDQQARRPQFSPSRLAGWYRLRVDGWPKDAAPPTEEDDWKAAKKHFEGDVPRSDLRRIRRDKADKKWLKPGPRKPR